jgi:hypothetical protein
MDGGWRQLDSYAHNAGRAFEFGACFVAGVQLKLSNKFGGRRLKHLINRTKMFHVKHFGTIRGRNLTWPQPSGGFETRRIAPTIGILGGWRVQPGRLRLKLSRPCGREMPLHNSRNMQQTTTLI